MYLPVVSALLCGVLIAVVAILTSKYWMSDLGRFIHKLRSSWETAIEEFNSQLKPPEDSDSQGE
jgi:hypothetical protein